MEAITQIYCYAQNMDKQQFIRENAEKFINSGKQRLMLVCRIGVSEREARYIAKKLEARVHAENPSAIIEMYTNAVIPLFTAFREIQEQQDLGHIDNTDEAIGIATDKLMAKENNLPL